MHLNIYSNHYTFNIKKKDSTNMTSPLDQLGQTLYLISIIIMCPILSTV